MICLTTENIGSITDDLERDPPHKGKYRTDNTVDDIDRDLSQPKIYDR